MSNKMLIDASHPEETRVAVVRGNRVEEFDFESQEKKQLRGNIYLAKVARVEPSLQAAFVDYGGNRHGFLAFSEIHPDYYQIPVADRQALLEAEAAEARASREAEEREDGDDNTTDEEPKKKSRRRRSRKSKAAATTDDNAENEVETDTEETEAVETIAESSDVEEDAVAEAPKARSTRRRKAPVKKADAQETTEDEVSETASEEPATEAVEEDAPKKRSTRRKKAPVKKAASEPEVEVAEETASAEETLPADEEEKPKRRSTRRKKAPVKKADAEDTSDENSDNGDDTPTTMAAMVEMDEISEDLPESGSDDDSSEDNSSEEPVAAEKPKRRSTSRKKAPTKKAKAEEKTEEEASEEAPTEEASSEETGEEEKPKRKSTRRRSPRKKKAEAAEDDDQKSSEDDADNNNDAEDTPVESVGQEDALEEVPQPKRLRRHYKIQEVIKRRQVLLVQVVKEERGNKGAALTTYLSLAGRYSVLMPNTARGGGISRKITNAADRKRLKAIASELDVPQGMGVILRTAGASRTNEEITRDFEYLMRLWEQVRNLTLSSSAPCLVYEEGSLIKRSIRDLYDKNTGEVIVAGEDGFNEAKDFMTMLMPNAANKVKQHRDKQSIFAKFNVDAQLDRMVTPQVTLKSGGYLIIDQTEALVAVDVNSGRSTREHSVEDTALQTNLEAAEEVARQLRLRDLAGLIVIDFIDMEEKRNIRSVEKKLKDCLKNDRARIQVGRISHFGLMEMSRQRMRASVLESTMDVCPLCGGTGHVRSDSAIALHVFRAIEDHVSRHNKYDAIVKTTHAIAMNMLNFKRASLLELEQRYGLQVIVTGSVEIKGQDFVIEKGELATGEAAPSVGAMQSEAAFEALDKGDEEQEGGKGHGRGRNRNRKQHDNAEETSNEETPQNTEETSDGDDDRPRKKRRRGKRGGRNRKPDDEVNLETSEVENKDAVQEASAEVAADEPQTETVSEEADADAEKPRARSTRRKKAPVTPKKEEPEANEEPAVVEAEEASASETEVEEKPKRRSTRRKKAPVIEEAEAAEVQTTSEEPAKEAEPTATNEKPKKTNWWNRGGGFF